MFVYENMKCNCQSRFVQPARISHHYHGRDGTSSKPLRQKKKEKKKKDSKMEIVSSFPADPVNVCAVPKSINQKPRSLIPKNIDNPKTPCLSNLAQSETCGLPFACAERRL